MKTKLRLILSGFFVLASSLIFAQQKTISGSVSDSNGLPLPGVNILVKNSTVGTQSDFDGNYTIQANAGETLVFSYVGFGTQEVPVTASTNTVNVTLEEDAAQLDEVIVTAQGIRKEKKALGYAVSTVSSEQLEQKGEGDIARVLQGKATGVRITQTSGLSGSGTQFLIRGLTSPGNNQPLFIVDGVPFDSGNNGGGSGTTSSSRFLDLDPNNIESVNVLKGLSATTLYGSDGRNGVVIITTKSAASGDYNKKTEITITQSTFFNEIASLPDYTRKQGQGYYGAYFDYQGNWGAAYGNPGQGNVDENGNVPHPYAGSANALAAFPEFATADYKYQFYDRDSFFRTGVVNSTSINANGGTEKTKFSMSYSNLYDQGFLPGNRLKRDAFSIGGSAKLSNNFTVSGVLNTTFTNYQSPRIFDIFSAFNTIPTSVNFVGLPFQSPIDGSEISFRDAVANPLWVVNNTGSEQDVNRTFGNFNATYNFGEGINLTYRLGLDTYTELNTIYQNRGSNSTNAIPEGSYFTDNFRSTIFDHTILLDLDKDLSDVLNLNAQVGANSKSTRIDYSSTSSTGQANFGILGHEGFENTTANSSVVGQTGRARRLNKPALFAQATLGINNFLYFTANGRQEWTSNFVNNSIFYPGASFSFVPTSLIRDLGGDLVNYIKIRGGYGTSAGFDDGYPTFAGLVDNAQSFIRPNGDAVATVNQPNLLANTDLDPFNIEEYEVGIETRFFNNRFSFNGSYFYRITNNLIFTRDIDPASGGTLIPQNINEFETTGFEFDFEIIPVKTEDIRWSINGFFTTNETKVTELDVDRALFASPFSNSDLGNYLVEGLPVTTIVGTAVLRDDAEEGSLFLTDGNLVVDSTGENYLQDPDLKVIGDANPDFISSLGTSFSYKNFTLSMLWQYQHGGDIYSTTTSTLLQRGISTATDNVDPTQGVILTGVFEDGTPNNIVNDSGDAYLNLYGNADEFSIFDATTIRLQDVSLTYNFSDKALEKTPFGSFSVSLIGQNLWFDAVNIPDGVNLDTNTLGTNAAGNGSGFETQIGPSSRRYGVSLKTTF
ncbi:SusC/RagA family TonB-linked outer membrane protein [Flavobacteriaceae bacterium TK19130]|nr:SusC/RagA family TonB-linked outer membrane protein [Thermobacterium salinum]